MGRSVVEEYTINVVLPREDAQTPEAVVKLSSPQYVKIRCTGKSKRTRSEVATLRFYQRLNYVNENDQSIIYIKDSVEFGIVDPV